MELVAVVPVDALDDEPEQVLLDCLVLSVSVVSSFGEEPEKVSVVVV